MKRENYLFIVNFAIIVSILNILHVIVGYAKTLPGQIYMGTGHYYLDYFEYVQAISQGMRGGWLWDSKINTGLPVFTIFGQWQYLLIGKIGWLFKLNPIVTYWVSVVVFSLLLSLLMFKLITKIIPQANFIRQLSAYLLALFAGPFTRIVRINNSYRLLNYELWNDKSTLFKRFSSVPYHISAQILVVIILLIIIDTVNKLKQLTYQQIAIRGLITCCISVFLMTFNPATFILVSGGLLFAGLILIVYYRLVDRKKILPFLVLFGLIFLVTMPVGFVVKKFLTDSIYTNVSQAETGWQVIPSLKEFLLISGPLMIIAITGIVNFIRKLSAAKIVILCFSAVSFLLYLTPLAIKLGTTNTRFFSPLTYLLLGVLAVSSIKSVKFLIIVTISLLIFFIPVNAAGFCTLINDTNLNSPITYLPKGIIEGLEFLETIPDKKTVLTTPAQFLGMIVSIYSGKPIYLARPGQKNYYERADLSYRLYKKLLSEEEARSFLNNNKIGYIITTSIEGFYQPGPLLKYPFLKEIYRNPDIVIFQVI